jgi:F-type H+-transporting ATPase subunit gamma
MPTLKEIQKNLEVVSTIKNIVTTFQEIANLKMQQIKEKVLKNRDFSKELLRTYQRIKSVYYHSLEKGLVKKGFFRKTEKEKAVIFLSVNKPFYGTLILDIWKEVKKYLEREGGDLIVVGRVGKYLAEREGFGLSLYYFEFDDINPEKERISEIVEFVKKYEKIIVFHGRYEKGLVQKPAMSEISGGLPEEKKERKIEGYLFEPSPEAVLDFFETEIIGVLFNIAILEHQLARLAARVMAMQEASERAKNFEKKLKATENKLKREIINKRQIELLGSLKT